MKNTHHLWTLTVGFCYPQNATFRPASVNTGSQYHKVHIYHLERRSKHFEVVEVVESIKELPWNECFINIIHLMSSLISIFKYPKNIKRRGQLRLSVTL
jgi:hypothetical protein